MLGVWDTDPDQWDSVGVYVLESGNGAGLFGGVTWCGGCHGAGWLIDASREVVPCPDCNPNAARRWLRALTRQVNQSPRQPGRR